MTYTGTLRSPSDRGGGHPRIVVVGDPEDNHCSLFATAARRVGLATVCHRYDQAYRDPGPLLADASGADFVRFETPGRGPALRTFLLETGVAVSGNGPTPAALAQAVARKGQIVAPHLWHAGFTHVLHELQARIGAVSSARFLATAAEIVAMFDKCACHARLAAAGLPVPPSLDPVASFEELQARMEATGMTAVFVKLRHGSAASGIVALRSSRGRMRATTTVEQTKGDDGETLLFNSRRVRTLTNPHEIATLVNALCRYGVHVERWVPKLGIAGKNADLRALVIDSRVACQVVRMSKTPITNLHLGGERADPSILHQRLRPGCLEQALASCVRIGQCFPEAFQYAVDLALTSDGKNHRILEVNAFGDLLKSVEIDGVDPYTYQLSVLADPEGWNAA